MTDKVEEKDEELSDVQKIELEFALKQSMYPNM